MRASESRSLSPGESDRYFWRENTLQGILCYTKIVLTPSYWNYLPVPRLASKPAVLQAFSLVALAIRRLRSEQEVHGLIFTSRNAFAKEQSHNFTYKLTMTKGEKPTDKANYHGR